MIHFAVVDDDGRILRTGVCAPELAHLQGDTVVLLLEPATPETHYWNGTDIVPLPAEVAGGDYQIVDGVPVADLAAARTRQRRLINAARNAAQDAGCDTPSGRFDTAGRSREFLNGAALAATLAALNEQPFSVNWTLSDNSVVTLDGPAIIAAGVAVAGWVDAVHQRARVLKERIDAAETLAAIRAVEWSLADPD